ncbi:hypothetical protein PPYR_13874 [Photinus pyralis]|uniref:Cytochrome P450 n=1 Tax=Photinus pyralis TaxID=7054 RepID=A0A1Y1MPW3_PHOPY|nr:hypothetical protein PPYR_13874 [Photinus pyralis]
MFVNEDVDRLWAKTLFLLRGDEWKTMRSTLSPSFTGNKMQGMFGLLKRCTDDLVQFYVDHPSAAKTVDIKDAFTRCANDGIASAAFGITCNSLENPNNEFYKMAKKATDATGFWINLAFLVVSLGQPLAKLLNLRVLSKEADKFFRNLVKETIDVREKSGIIRPDMIHLLMESRKGKLKYDATPEDNERFSTFDEKGEQLAELTDENITAQVLIFLFAGFDSTATLMTFLAYELAVNPDIQVRLKEEIDDTLRECNGSLTYEAIMNMRYMDMVILETLRKWPSIIAINRICLKPYTIDPITPGEKPIHVNKGDTLWIPVYAMHRNPNFYPEPERFNPERFSDENKSKIVPGSYFPFGSGPRLCIGNRFAMLETKLLFFSLLSKFEIIAVEKTQIDLAVENTIWAGFRLR